MGKSEKIGKWVLTVFLQIVLVFMIFSSVEGTLAFCLNHPNVLTKFKITRDFFRGYYINRDRNIVQYSPQWAVYSHSLSYTLKPGRFIFSNREFSVAYEVNKLGVRDDNDSLNSPEIVVIGDSQAMGWGVNQDDTFTQLIEKRCGVRVLNAAVSSYGTAREMRLLERIDTSKLKYLIIQYADNDYEENLKYYNSNNSLPIMGEAEYNNLVNTYLLARQRYYGKITISMADYILRKIILKIEKKAPPDNQGITSNEDDDTMKNNQVDDADLFLNVLTTSKTDLSSTHIIVVEVNSYGRQDHFIDLLKEKISAGRYPDYIKNIAAIDLSTGFKKSDFYILDDHMNEYGHRYIAETIINRMNNLTGEPICRR